VCHYLKVRVWGGLRLLPALVQHVQVNFKTVSRLHSPAHIAYTQLTCTRFAATIYVSLTLDYEQWLKLLDFMSIRTIINGLSCCPHPPNDHHGNALNKGNARTNSNEKIKHINAHTLWNFSFIDTEPVQSVTDQLTELRFYIPLDTKYVILEMLFPANLLAS